MQIVLIAKKIYFQYFCILKENRDFLFNSFFILNLQRWRNGGSKIKLKSAVPARQKTAKIPKSCKNVDFVKLKAMKAAMVVKLPTNIGKVICFTVFVNEPECL